MSRQRNFPAATWRPSGSNCLRVKEKQLSYQYEFLEIVSIYTYFRILQLPSFPSFNQVFRRSRSCYSPSFTLYCCITSSTSSRHHFLGGALLRFSLRLQSVTLFTYSDVLILLVYPYQIMTRFTSITLLFSSFIIL